MSAVQELVDEVAGLTDAATKLTSEVVGQKEKLDIIVNQAIADAASANGNPLGEYANGITFASHNDYVSDNGLFRLSESVGSPYTTDTSTYPNASDDPNLVAWSNTSKEYVDNKVSSSEVSIKGHFSQSSGAANIGAAGGTVQQTLDALKDGQNSGVIVFQTYALLDTYTPINNTEKKGSFKVANDGESYKNGYYSWVSGTVYVKDADLIVNTIDANNTSDAVSGSAVYNHTISTLSESPLLVNAALAGGTTSATEPLSTEITWIESAPLEKGYVKKVIVETRSGEIDTDIQIKLFTKTVDNYFTQINAVDIVAPVEGVNEINLNLEVPTDDCYIGFYASGLLNYGVTSGSTGYYQSNGNFSEGEISTIGKKTKRIAIEYYGNSGILTYLNESIESVADELNNFALSSDIADLESDLGLLVTREDPISIFYGGQKTLISSGGANTTQATWILDKHEYEDVVITSFSLDSVFTAGEDVYVKVFSKDPSSLVFTVEREVIFTSALGLNTFEMELPVYRGEYLGIFTSGIFEFNATGGVAQGLFAGPGSTNIAVSGSGLFVRRNYYFPWSFTKTIATVTPVATRAEILEIKSKLDKYQVSFDRVEVPHPGTNVISLDYEINLFTCYGQSLTVAGRSSGGAISTTQNYDNLMFTRGMRPQHAYEEETATEWYASLIPAVEDGYETPNMGMGDMIKGLINAGLDENAIYSYKMLLNSSGYGGKTIAQLSKGGEHYARLITSLKAGETLSYAQNDSYKAHGMSWLQGESDYDSGTTREEYVELLKILIADLKDDISEDFKVISTQLSNHYVHSNGNPTIALAISDVAETRDDLYIACPLYHLHYSDQYHPYNTSTRVMGGYLGIAYKKVFVDGVPFKPLTIKTATVINGNQIHLKLHVPVGSLVIDTTIVQAAENYGFEVEGHVISSVSITSQDTIKIVIAGTITGGEKLKYAATGTTDNSNDAGKPRGNIRDTQGDTQTLDISGTPYPMHNWLLISEVVL
jgi:hypothetical protein